MVRNLCQSIPILPIRGVNQLRRFAFLLKQHTERRPLSLRLPARNVPNYSVRLMPRHKLVGPQIDLAGELLPRRWRATPLGHEGPIAFLRNACPLAKVTQHPVGREPARRLTLPRRCAITAPPILSWMLHQFGPDRIQHHIATQFEQMGVLLDQDGFEPSLQDVPHTMMPPVVPLRVQAIELAHPQREVGLRGFYQQMIVIVHKAIGMTAPAIALDDVGEHRQPLRSVAVIGNDILPGIAPTGDVIDGARKFDA